MMSAILVSALLSLQSLQAAPQPPLPKEIPSVLVTIDGKRHRLVFTVDDHPHRSTPAMLRVLKRYCIRATFFVVGWHVRSYLRYPRHRLAKLRHGYLLRIHRAGHLLGNHSLKHANMCRLPASAIRYQIAENQRVIKRATGVTMRWWRSPGGIWCRKLVREVRRAKLRTLRPYPRFSWHVHDYKKSAYWMWRMTRRRVRHRHRYTILLFHHGANKLNTYMTLLRRNSSPNLAY